MLLKLLGLCMGVQVHPAQNTMGKAGHRGAAPPGLPNHLTTRVMPCVQNARAGGGSGGGQIAFSGALAAYTVGRARESRKHEHIGNTEAKTEGHSSKLI